MSDITSTELRLALLDFAGVANGHAKFVAPFSPGPWWGFNGIEYLVLTTSDLLRLKLDWNRKPKRIVEQLVTSQIAEVEVSTRRSPFKVALRLTTNDGVRRRFTSNASSGLDLALRLQAEVTGDSTRPITP